jgi:DNA-binding transcriptional regulator YiaG
MTPSTAIPPLTKGQFRAKLRALGISQRSFAQCLQMDVGTVNRWATGKIEIPHWVRVLLDLMRQSR